MIDLGLLAQIIAVIACIVIIWRTEPALAHMTSDTHIAVRIAMWLAVVGAVSRVAWVAMGGIPDPITILMLIGMAKLILCERRLSVLTGSRRRRGDWERTP